MAHGGLGLRPPVAAGSSVLSKESEAHESQQTPGFSFFCCFDILGKLVLNLICPGLSGQRENLDFRLPQFNKPSSTGNVKLVFTLETY